MTKHRKILNLIGLIRDSHPDMVHTFTHGSCLNFFCILHAIYPEAKPWFNIAHVITEIDGKFYDITGVVNTKNLKEHELKYIPFTDWYNKRRTSHAFNQMYRYTPTPPPKV